MCNGRGRRRCYSQKRLPHLFSLEFLTNAGWVLTLILPPDLEGQCAQVGANKHKSLAAGAHGMTGQRQGQSARIMAIIISLESPQAHASKLTLDLSLGLVTQFPGHHSHTRAKWTSASLVIDLLWNLATA